MKNLWTDQGRSCIGLYSLRICQRLKFSLGISGWISRCLLGFGHNRPRRFEGAVISTGWRPQFLQARTRFIYIIRLEASYTTERKGKHHTRNNALRLEYFYFSLSRLIRSHAWRRTYLLAGTWIWTLRMAYSSGPIVLPPCFSLFRDWLLAFLQVCQKEYHKSVISVR